MPNLIDLPGQAVAKAQQYLARGSAELHYVRKIIEAGAFRLEPPQNYAAMANDIFELFAGVFAAIDMEQPHEIA